MVLGTENRRLGMRVLKTVFIGCFVDFRGDNIGY